MKELPNWTRLPSKWIEAGGLRQFRWAGGCGADSLAALMALTAIANHTDPLDGIARMSYDALCDATTLSRAKLSAGLSILAERGLVTRAPDGRGTYGLTGYDLDAGWAQFPARGLYRNGTIAAFTSFHLRQAAELEALKLYFLFASRRDRATNWALITYDKIEEYSGVTRANIRRALSVLGANSLVCVDIIASTQSENGVANAYRLVQLHQRLHMGTLGRKAASLGEL